MRKIGEGIGKFVVKYKIGILIFSLFLLIPSVFGYMKTRINYDILLYLPQDIETMKGQDILTKDFDMGSFAMCSIEHMSSYKISQIEEQFRQIEGVNKVISPVDLIGTTIPLEMLPDDVSSSFQKGDTRLMLVTFKDSTIAIDAIKEMRQICDDSVKIGGMSASTLDTSIVADSEIIHYILIAVALVLLVLTIFLDSYLVPFLLLGNIGMAILYNMGSNVFLGEISYITKAIAAVLQLGVTTDFSIFLYHKYEHAKTIKKSKEEAMIDAIGDTLVSVSGSALTTVAGFLALCSMQLILGRDIGIVMAKGVVFGVIATITIFPALLLCFDSWIVKFKHRSWIPNLSAVRSVILKRYRILLLLAIIAAIPAIYGNNRVKQYYNLRKDLPAELQSCIANSELEDKFNIVSAEVVLMNKQIKSNNVNEMIAEIKKLDGIELILSPSQIASLGIPDEMMSDDIKSIFESNQYQMILINSQYETATNQLNQQIEQLDNIVKKYDKDAILAGEGPCMKDLVTIADQDFQSVNLVSIGIIFIIMMLVFKSISLPILLILGIESAIFMNMAISYYQGVTLPFVASIVIGTIQLGATIDYAILLTTKYIEQRKKGTKKYQSMDIALKQSMHSIFVSALSFFAATFSVGMISKLNMIASLCTLMSRGSVISMLVVICVIPSLLLVFDKIIIKTTSGFKKGVVSYENE